MALLGVRTKRSGQVLEKYNFVSDPNVASGVIAAGAPIYQVVGTGKMAQVADNAVLAWGFNKYAVTAAQATAGVKLAVIPGGNDTVFRSTYAGSGTLAITSIGTYVGTDGSKVDIDNTTQELFRIEDYGTDANGVAWVEVTIPDELCQANLEVE